jgi:galactokinase
MTRDAPRETFERLFGAPPEVSVSAPGRVNLLGEHTDYNEGFVLPMTVPRALRIEASQFDGVDAYSEQFGQRIVRDARAGRQGDWADYIVGSVRALADNEAAVRGIRLYMDSDIPMGAGLASSAATEVATLRALNALYGLSLTDLQIAQLAHRVETEFVGVRCGIMDQMVISVGTPNSALFLDTRTLDHEVLVLPPDHRVLTFDSGLPRRLAAVGYNERRRECEQAAALLRVRSLRDLGPADLPRVMELPDPLHRRARHVITENSRTLSGRSALRAGDAQRFGALMAESHRSLRDDFEVSVDVLDQLVEGAIKNGALGAKLTGAGFGGAIVALVPNASAPLLTKTIEQSSLSARSV